MKKVRMLTNAYGPERILEQGKTYLLPDDVADQLLAPYQPPLEQVQEVGADGVVRLVSRPMTLPPMRFAELVTDRAVKAIRPPAQPDPGDMPTPAGADDDDDFEDL